MPQTLNGYKYARIDGDFKVATRVSKPRLIYPYENDLSIFIIEEDQEVFTDYYETLTTKTRHDDFPNCYFVKDSPIQDIGQGVGKFVRLWALLPGYDATGKRQSYVRSVYESFVYQVPGITSTDQSLFLQWNVIIYSSNGTTITMQTSTPHDVAAGKLVQINYHVVDPLNKFTYLRSFVRKALPGTGGTTLIVNAITDINAVNIDSFKRSDGAQDPYNKTVSSRIDIDYWLPGINVSTVNAIPIIQEFRIIGPNGNRSVSLSDTSSPSTSDYLNLIDAGTWIVAEPSVIRLYMGNIYSRSTRYVQATF